MSRISEEGRNRCLVLFTKPPRPGRVKTRLIGDLTADQAARLHEAFVSDVLARLASGPFDLRIAWALEPGESMPWNEIPGEPQVGGDLGSRLHHGLASAAREHAFVAAVGSDLPTLDAARVGLAFAKLEESADVVFGPVEDGGYYLIALRRSALRPELFAGIAWSTERVLSQSLERCRAFGLVTELLPQERDIDTPPDLEALVASLSQAPHLCPSTHAVLAEWGRLPPTTVPEGVA